MKQLIEKMSIPLPLHHEHHRRDDSSDTAYSEKDQNHRPLIILHGLFGSSSNWRSIAKEVAKERDVYCLDLRNHGQSPWSDTMDYPAMARDVAQFIETHHIPSPDVLGHSMGGKTLMTLLLNDITKIHRAVVVDIAPVTYSHDHFELVDIMKSVSFDHIERRSQIDDTLAERITEKALRAFLLQNITRIENRYRWRINIDSIHTNMPLLTGFEANGQSMTDTLFVAGGESDYVQQEHHQAITDRFPHSRVEVIQGAGHWLHAEKPKQLLQLLSDFLK